VEGDAGSGRLDLSVHGGIADDEFAADDNSIGRVGGGGAAELIEEAAGDLFAHLFAGIVDRG